MEQKESWSFKVCLTCREYMALINATKTRYAQSFWRRIRTCYQTAAQTTVSNWQGFWGAVLDSTCWVVFGDFNSLWCWNVAGRRWVQIAARQFVTSKSIRLCTKVDLGKLLWRTYLSLKYVHLLFLWLGVTFEMAMWILKKRHVPHCRQRHFLPLL